VTIETAAPAVVSEPAQAHLDERTSTPWSIDRLRLDNRSLKPLTLLLPATELAAVAFWTLFVSWFMLGTSKNQLVGGNDYFVSVQGRLFWDHVRACGACALWNGDARGGAPAFVDANVDILHPIVAFPAYLFGALQGSKVTLVFAFFLGGLAVWWLARELGAGAIARVATACMFVASGAMIGRLQEGLVVLVTATATASLILPATIRLARLPNRRSSAILGLMVGLTIVSGQGYIQIGIALMSPLALLLIVGNSNGWRRVTLYFAISAALGLLIGMAFIFPFARIYGDFSKIDDVAFGNYQPMRYLALNLVISDYQFLESEALGKPAFAAWFALYVGWIPVALAVVGGYRLWFRSRRLALYLLLWFLAALWIGSGDPLRHLGAVHSFPGLREFAESIRIPSFIAALAIPPLLGLAALAIDAGVKWMPHLSPKWSLSRQSRSNAELLLSATVRLVVILLIIVSLRDLRQFSKAFFWLDTIDPAIVDSMVANLSTESLAWVSPPDNDSKLDILGMDAGLKYARTWRAWELDSRPLPPAFRAIQAAGEPPQGMVPTGNWESYFTFEDSQGNRYVTAPSGGACSASGEGGNVDVHCDLSVPGRVVVQENDYGSWHATINGSDTPILRDGSWIAVDAPAGSVDIRFRYRPWDFWVGLAISAIGVLLAVALLAIPSRLRFHVRWDRVRFSLNSVNESE
jgi:hypothetical protein